MSVVKPDHSYSRTLLETNSRLIEVNDRIMAVVHNSSAQLASVHKENTTQSSPQGEPTTGLYILAECSLNIFVVFV